MGCAPAANVGLERLRTALAGPRWCYGMKNSLARRTAAEASTADQNVPRRGPADQKRLAAGGGNSSPVHLRYELSRLWSNLKGNKTMLTREFLGGSLASLVVAGAMLLAPVTAEAAISPAPVGAYVASDVQNVGCLLGA